MKRLTGYRIVAQLHVGVSTSVFRVIREEDQKPFIIRILNRDLPSASEIAQLRHEFTITRALKIDGIAHAVELTEYENLPALLYEDFDGVTLKQYLAHNKRLDLDVFFKLAIRIVEVLGKIHATNITHKRISADSILVSSLLDSQLCDLRMATVISQENTDFSNSNLVEGNPAYISPEQTGRMNRSADYRSDFYSLGVVFYEMLCGRLPFLSEDTLELIFAHIATRPAEPEELVQEIGQMCPVVSRIVMKLLSKNAEERYQSAWGLTRDLEECRRRWDKYGRIAEFVLAQNDRSDKFRLHEKLYGRQTQLNVLLSAFERVARGAKELLLVAGFSGVGKTSLVQDLYKPITARRGYFISGKYEQLQRNNPYRAVVSAFRNLVRQLLAESDTRLERWKHDLLAALGPNGRVVTEVIPEVERIIGLQTPLPAMGPVESQNRFEMVFQDFIRVFCQAEHPLTIFLDDLQWADSASLKLMRLMMTDEKTRYLLVIGAYRDNEVDAAHPLTITLREMRDKGIETEPLRLPPLALEHVTALVSDSLYAPVERARPLAELLTEKTAGNPFFIGMFLKTLYSEKLLTFDYVGLQWQWDLTRIRKVEITEDVAELLSGKIRGYGVEIQRLLQLAACIGNQFSLDALARISGMPSGDIAQALFRVAEDGLVSPSNEAYKLLSVDDPALADDLEVTYRFAHDRVQKAAYSLVEAPERDAIHRRIGQELLQQLPADELDEKIFDIVNQLNLADALLGAQEERDELAELNLKAGRKAKAAAAFGVAHDYLCSGVKLLTGNCWQRRYELSLALHVETAEAAYLSGNYGQMEALATEVERNANSLLDKVRVYEVRMDAYKAQYRMKDAVELALSVLQLLGERVPLKPSTVDLAVDHVATMWALTGKKVEDLAHLEQMQDPIKKAIVRVVMVLGSAAFFVAPEALPIPVFRVVRYFLRYGHTPQAASLYAAYGLILCVMGKFDLGYRFGTLALRLEKENPAKTTVARTHFLVYAFSTHWKKHLRTTLQPLRDGFQTGLENGDLEYGCYCALWYCLHSLFCGQELTGVQRDFAAYRVSQDELKQETAYHNYCIFQQLVANLLGHNENPCSLEGEFFSEAEKLPKIEAAEDFTTGFLIYIAKLILSFLFRDFKSAARNAERAEAYLEGAGAFVTVPLFKFYSSLAYLAVFRRIAPEQQHKVMRKVLKNQSDMRIYKRVAPMNHAHRYHLVEAERMKVIGERKRAEEHYEKAIALAKKNQYAHEEALANELAASFHLFYDETEAANEKLHKAVLGYRRWGAEAKVRRLKDRYSDVLHCSDTPGDTPQVDLKCILEATKAISEEILLDRLLRILMKVVLTNAGADVGFLLIPSEGKLLIEAEKARDADEITVLSREPYDKGHRLATPIVRSVFRNLEPELVDNPGTDNRFREKDDPYLHKYRPASVLCMPIMRKGSLIAILYLENSLTTGAFTPTRTEMLEYLSAQIAVSLENARLYAKLERSELRFRELYDNIADSVVLVGGDDRIVVANPGFYQVIGVNEDDSGTTTFARWVHRADLETVEQKIFVPLREGKEVKDVAFRLVSAHGAIHDMECNARTLERESGYTEFQLVLRDVTERKALQDRLIKSLQDVQNARSGTILGLAKLAEYRDEATGRHLERIREFARIIALELAKKPKYKDHITPEYVDDIYFSSVLHDIGKVGVRDEILLKPGALTDEEFAEIKSHPTIGGDVLKAVEAKVGHQSFLRIGMQIAYCHHEKWNGNGYPKRLKGEEIPLAARIVALADVYDALTSRRVYKPKIPHDETLETIVRDSGTHFDPEVVEAFLTHQEEFDRIRREMHQEEEGPLPEPEQDT